MKLRKRKYPCSHTLFTHTYRQPQTYKEHHILYVIKPCSYFYSFLDRMSASLIFLSVRVDKNSKTAFTAGAVEAFKDGAQY